MLCCTATQRKKETQVQKNVLTIISRGLVIAVTNNSFIDSKEPKYLVTILKALTRAFDG